MWGVPRIGRNAGEGRSAQVEMQEQRNGDMEDQPESKDGGMLKK